MTKTEKTTLISVEKTELNRARKNISKWIEGGYFSGGASSNSYSARTDEDLELAQSLNKSTKLVPAKKLNNVIKSLKSESQEQAMYQDSATLTKLSNNIKKLA